MSSGGIIRLILSVHFIAQDRGSLPHLGPPGASEAGAGVVEISRKPGREIMALQGRINTILSNFVLQM
jgi:hypothetical protein